MSNLDTLRRPFEDTRYTFRMLDILKINLKILFMT